MTAGQQDRVDDSVPHVEMAAQRVGQGVFGAEAGIAEGHGGGNRGDAELFQGVQRAGLHGMRQVARIRSMAFSECISVNGEAMRDM